jgi:nucleoside-diphosphate-sugar epimerase
MRIFVTGATGFIGRHLCERLVARGDEVVAMVRTPEKARRLPPGVRSFRGDLASLAQPDATLPACDVVIHLAGVIAARTLEGYEAVNHRAVVDLLACLGRQSWSPERFLFASSLAAAGPSPQGVALTEADPPNPIDPYGVAKAKAEVAVRAAAFPTTTFRPPIVFGPGDEASLTLFRAARAGIGFRVAGPRQKLSFVDVRDLVEAIVAMADDRRPGHFLYFASHPRPIDVGELWEALANAVQRRVIVAPVPRWALYSAMRVSTWAAPIFGYDNQLDAKQYRQMTAPAFVCSSERIRQELGWAARHDLVEALTNAAIGYQSAGLLPRR